MNSLNQPNKFSVSVIIPAYNVEHYIARAINSVLKQTLLPQEIIIVDDGSTDNTAKIIEKFEGKIRYVYQENQGLSSARNTGIKLATSEWIALLDADDEWLPNKNELQIDVLKKHRDLVWIDSNIYRSSYNSQDFIVYNDLENITKLLANNSYFNDFFEAASKDILFSCSSILLKKELFKQIGYFDETLSYAEDLDFWIRVYIHHHKIGYIKQPLAIYYFQRPNSLTHNMGSLKILENLLRILLKTNTASLYNNHSFRLFMCEKINKHLFNYYNSIEDYYKHLNLELVRHFCSPIYYYILKYLRKGIFRKVGRYFLANLRHKIAS